MTARITNSTLAELRRLEHGATAGPWRHRGTMHPGCSPVLITDVMIFYVTHTGAA